MQRETSETTTHHERSSEHRIDLESAYRLDPTTGKGRGHGNDRMFFEGEFIGESHQPAFDAARWLLTNGLALPSDRLTTYRGDMPCLYTVVGRAARLTVRETGKSGPKIVAYRGAEHAEKFAAWRKERDERQRATTPAQDHVVGASL